MTTPHPTTAPNTAALFLDASRKTLLTEYWPRLRTCIASLSGEQIWWRPNPSSNAIGNLVLHLNGNLRQWIVTAFGSQPDQRDRPAEFAAQGSVTGAELLARLGQTIEETGAVLERLTEADLVAPMDIQGYTTTGLAAVCHVIEHFGLHYGQICYITKLLRNTDLAFYPDLNTTGRLPDRKI